jgi:hypothetical protein
MVGLGSSSTGPSPAPPWLVYPQKRTFWAEMAYGEFLHIEKFRPVTFGARVARRLELKNTSHRRTRSATGACQGWQARRTIDHGALPCAAEMI